MKRCVSFIAALGICFLASIAAADAQVKADTGGIAIGGSVTGSTVFIGIPQQKVDELVRDAKRPLEELTIQQRDNIVLLREKLELNVRQVHAALAVLGENDIPPERLAAKLVEIAQRFKDLQTTASARPGDDPKTAALKIDADKAIDAGKLVEADSLLADVEIEQRRGLERLAVDAAETSLDAGIFHSLGCGTAKPQSISPMRLHCFLQRAVMRTSKSATYKKRQAHSISRETNSATTMLCFPRLSDTTGYCI